MWVRVLGFEKAGVWLVSRLLGFEIEVCSSGNTAGWDRQDLKPKNYGLR